MFNCCLYRSLQQQSLGSGPSQEEFKSKDKSKSINDKGGNNFDNPLYCDLKTYTNDMEPNENIYEALN